VIIKVDMANEPKQQPYFAENSIVEKNSNTRTVQAESSKFASFLFDQGFQLVIPPKIVTYVPEPIVTPTDGILY
jgi:hypothetical protein